MIVLWGKVPEFSGLINKTMHAKAHKAWGRLFGFEGNYGELIDAETLEPYKQGSCFKDNRDYNAYGNQWIICL